jgi:hypothetical protein
MPFSSNGQSGFLYPPNYIHFLLPENLALWLFAFGHSLFLMVGSYFLGRTLGLCRRASFLVAVLFGLGNANAGHLFGGHLTFLPARSYWPWEAAFLLRTLRGQGGANAVCLAACVALGLAAGAPQIWLFGLLVCAAILLVWFIRLIWFIRPTRRQSWQGALPLLLSAVLIALWCAPTLLPLRELRLWSSHGDQLTFEQIATLAATPRSLVRLLLNGFFGGNSFVMWSLPGNPGEDAASLGLAPFLLASLAPFLAPASRLVRWIYAGCLLAIVLALGAATPLYRVLYDHVFFFQITRVPARWLELWAFGAALLGGFSFDALLKNPARAPMLQKLWITGAAAVALLFLGSSLTKTPWEHGAQIVAKTLALPSSRLPELASSLQNDALLTCTLASGTLALLAFIWRRGLTKSTVVVAVMLVLAAEPLMQFWLSTRIASAESLEAAHIPTPLLQRYQPGQRWIIQAPFSQLNASFFSGIDAFNGYEPFGSSQFFEFVAAAQGPTEFTADFQPRTMAPLWRVAGSSHLLWKAKRTGEQPEDFPGPEVAHEGEWHLKLLQDGLRPWPRAYLSSLIISSPEAQRYQHLSELARQPFGAAPAVVVEADFPSLNLEGVGKSGENASVGVRTSTPDILEWNISTPQDAVFVHQEAIAPGWKAFVDGQEAPLHRVNGFFRGVRVARGARKVAITYDSQTLRFSLFLGLCGLGLAAAVYRLPLRRGVRKADQLTPPAPDRA